MKKKTVVTTTVHEPCGQPLEAELDERGNMQAWPGDNLHVQGFCRLCDTPQKVALVHVYNPDDL